MLIPYLPLIFAVLVGTGGVEVQDFYDIKCLDPFPKVARNIDYQWMHSISQWYIPLQSPLNFYRYAETLMEIPLANLTSEQIPIDTACLKFKWHGPQSLFGFGKRVAFDITHVIENKVGFSTKWKGVTRGRHYLTLRDNKSFVFFTTCWADGQASWSIISTHKTIDEPSRKQIMEHVESLGFKGESVLEGQYDGCEESLDKIEL